MARKPNYDFEKRQKEIAKKAKKEEKKKRKLEDKLEDKLENNAASEQDTPVAD
ncbi:MAG: hypothetical protein L3J63_01390 [Geopsychrobacter sp.]|nr:hypothetical protein [Geopsychrobacter sp.]